jgi:aspartate oxidase
VKVKKSDNDLLIEQLKETLRVLAADKIPTSKLEKRLEDVAHKWDEVKKLQPQVKSSVEPIQVRAHATACHLHAWSIVCRWWHCGCHNRLQHPCTLMASCKPEMLSNCAACIGCRSHASC